MNINYNIISIIDILGLVQGLFLGTFIICENRSHAASRFLGVFLILYSLELLEAILIDLNLINIFPFLNFLPLNFYFIQAPLFYLYSLYVIGQEINPRKYLILIPGVLEFLIFLFLFILPSQIKLQLLDNSIFMFLLMVILTCAIPYSLYFMIKTYRVMQKSKKLIKNYLADSLGKMIDWIKWMSICLICLLLMSGIMLFIDNDSFELYTYSLFSIINIVFIFTLGVFGIRQNRVLWKLSAFSSQHRFLIFDLENEKLLKKDFEKLRGSIISEEQFKNPQLTLSSLSKSVKMLPRYVSKLINQYSGHNFNMFINMFRVEEAKKLLHDDKTKHLNMLGIAYDSGFNSKASFYKVFKQITGTTPLRYKMSKSPGQESSKL